MYSDPHEPNVMYAGENWTGYFGSSLFHAIHKTSDGGESWITVNTGSFDVWAMAIDPRSPTHKAIYASTSEGVLKSTNEGGSWNYATNGMYDRHALSVAIDRENPDVVYAGTFASVYRSSNRGENWIEKTRGIEKSRPTDISVSEQTIFTVSANGEILNVPAASLINGSFDGGSTWSMLHTNLIGSEPGFLGTAMASRHGVQLAGASLTYPAYYSMKILRSTDNGITWDVPMTQGYRLRFVREIEFDPSDYNTVFAVTDQGPEVPDWVIFKSSDAGASWDEVYKTEGQDAYTIEFNPQSGSPSQVVYADGQFGVIKSSNGGRDWAPAGFAQATYSLALNPASPNIVYAGTALGIYKTTNEGGTWNHLDNSPSTKIDWLLLHPATTDIIYAVAPDQQRVYRTTNAGASWSEYVNGLPQTGVHRVRLDGDNPNVIYAATDDGVYSIPHVWTGELAANTSFHGGETYLVQGKLTVLQGVTLDIDPGAIVEFDSDAGVIVDGTLHADGVEFVVKPGSPDKWYGIILRNSSSSSINGCTISQAQYGVGLVSTTGEPQHPRVTGCAITDCDVGIYVWGVTEWDQEQSIFGNDLEGCAVGVVTNQGDTKCAPGFKSNMIRHSGTKGMWIERSKPTFLDNLIEMSSDVGVYCRFDGDAQFGVVAHLPPPEYNTIRDNNGVQVSAIFASPLLGLVWDENSCELFSAGLNRVYHGSDEVPRVYAYGPGTVVQADKCFWGWPVLSSWFIEEDKAQIIYRCPLKPEETPEEEMLAEAATLRAQGEYQQAISVYEDIVEQHGASDEASAAVTGLVQAYGEYAQHSADTTAQAEMVAYLEEQAEDHPNADVQTIAKLELARANEQKQGWQEALDIYNSLLQESSDTQLKSVVFRAMVNIYAGRLGDFNHARDVLNQMEQANLSAEHIEMAELDMALFSGEVLTLHGLGKRGSGNGGIAGSDLPTRYSLEQNFPNPFNPTTEIWFKLGGDGNMSLKLYDVLGREVKTLAEGHYLSGYYNVTLDAKDLASGLYFYRLNAGTFTSTKKLVVLK
jgi:photosystem II stability/assembly factor-like uncharacterized protein/tetratricopeptide (TPR) repeat protein